MEKMNTTDFQEVTVHLRKDFEFDVATPLEENNLDYVMNMLWNLMGKVDMDVYCLLEFDNKSRVIREITYTPRTFRNALRNPGKMLRQTILDKPYSVIAVRLTGYDFPKQINCDKKATDFMRKEEENMQQLGAILKLANVGLVDYIVSDYAMKKRFSFLEKELLNIPDEYFEQYLSYAKPLAGMVTKPDPVVAKEYDNRYPAELAPSWHYSGMEVQTPTDAIFAVRELIQDSDREILGIINLDGWKPLNFHLCAVGSTNSTAVDSGLLLRTTMLSNANAVILFHNHPSGDIEPSIMDFMMTEKVNCLCDKCGITMIDHVIIGFNNDFCYSFYRESIFNAEHKESPYKSMAEHIRETYFKEHTDDAFVESVESESIAAEKNGPVKRASRRR